MRKRFIFSLILLAGMLVRVTTAPADMLRAYDFEFKEMDLKKAIESIAALDKKNVVFSPKMQSANVTLSLTKVSPGFAMRLLLENYGYIVVEKGDVLHIMTTAERGPAATPTLVFPLTNVLAKDILHNVTPYLGSAGKATVNEQRNALIVSGPEDIVRDVGILIQELDRESNQVFIEGKVIETSTTFARNLGIRWGLMNSAGGGMGSLNTPSADNAMGANMVTGVVGARLVAQISAGERNGDLRVISSPKITTVSGMPANIESLTTYSVRTLQNTATATGQPQTVGALEKVTAGVSLKVTPYIVSKHQVRLNINISKSEPDFVHAIDNIPGIADNSATTSLVVKSGETATIGGLIYQSENVSKFSAPFMANIPVLGLLFGSRENKQEDRELLIFITPTIFQGYQPENLGQEVPSESAQELSAGVDPNTDVLPQANERKREPRIMIKPSRTDYSKYLQNMRPLRQPAEKITLDGNPKPAGEMLLQPSPAPKGNFEEKIPEAAK